MPGAVAFVRHYWDLANFAQVTGQVTQLRSLGVPSCQACNAGTKAIAEVYKRGGRIIGGGSYQTRAAHGTPLRAGSQQLAKVTITVHTERQRVVGAGSLNEKFSAGDAGYIFILLRQGNRWRVLSWDSRG